MEKETKPQSEQERRLALVLMLFPEMTKLGRQAAAIIQDAILFDKYIQTGERP